MKQRMTTAVFMLVVALPILIYGGLPFVILGIVLSLIAAYEMIKMRETVAQTPLEVKIFTMIATLSVVFYSFTFSTLSFTENSMINLDLLVVFLVTLLFIIVIRKSFTLQDAGYYLFTILYIGLTFHAMLYIRIIGLDLFLFLVCIITLTDTFAYFSGRKFGKRKLAPLISPKKTIEGAVGGTFFGSLSGVIYGSIVDLSFSPLLLILISLIISILGQIGDLVASSLKREYKIKDYGKVFPGHGGVLDRLDSQLFAALALYLILNLLNVVI